MSRRAWLSVLQAAVVLSTLSAPAKGATLAWQAPEECPGQEEAERQLRAALGMPLSEAASSAVHVQLERVAAGGGYVAFVRMRAMPGVSWVERALDADTCSSAAQAALVVISLALASPDSDASSVAPSTNGAEDDAASLPDEADDERSDEKLRAEVLSEPEPLTWGIEAGAIGDSGSLPLVSPGLELGGSVGSSRGGLRITGLALPQRTTSLFPPMGATFSLLAVALAGCRGSSSRVLTLRTCLGAELGRMAGQGTGVSQPGRGAAFWLSPRADIAAYAGPKEVQLFLRAGLAVPLFRPTFVLHDRPVHQAEVVVVRLGLGVEVELE